MKLADFSDDLSRINDKKGIKLLSLILAFLCVLFPANLTLFAQNSKNLGKAKILYINSYHPGYSWSDQITEGINSVFNNPSAEIETDLHIEYLDGKRYGPQQTKELGKLYISIFKEKNKNNNFDLVMVSDQYAYNLMKLARKQVFQNTPLIFAGVESPGKLPAKTAGIVSNTNLKENIELIFETIPNLKKILIITDQSVTGQINRAALKSIIKNLKTDVNFEFCGLEDNSTPQKIFDKAKKLNKKTDVIFFLDYCTCATGKVQVSNFLKQLTQISPAPVFSHADIYMNFGVIAGNMNSGFIQGKQLAEMALSILKGTPIETIGLQKETTQPAADYLKLKNYSINPSLFPSNTRFRNKPPESIIFYKKQVYQVSILLAVAVILIFALLIILRRQRKLRIEARQLATWFKTIFQDSPVPIAYYEPSGKIVAINDQFKKVLGYDKEDLNHIDEWWVKAYPEPDYRNNIIKDWNDAISKLQPGEKMNTGEYQIACKNGSKKTMSVAASILEGCIITSFFDITAKKKAEEQLRNSEENLRITLNSIGDAVIATDTKGLITRMNPVAEKLTGWQINDATGKELCEVFNIISADTREPIPEVFEHILSSESFVNLGKNTILIAKNGQEFLVADSGAPIFSKTREIVGFILVFRDITEEYSLQTQLAQSQKMDAIGQLAGGVAHDFNNMLSGIIGSAEILQLSLPQEASKQQKLLSLIISSAERAADLTHQLLTFSRKKRIMSTAIDVHEAISDTVELLNKTLDKRISVICELNAEKASVIGDGSLLRSAFLNLGINASHAMPEGGTLTIKTSIEKLSATAANLQSLTHEYYLQINVTDTGCGIEKENLTRIFEPFFTTKGMNKGTGLGLAAVYGTIQQHKGKISVQSEIDKGTTFTILLPLANHDFSPKITAKETIHGSGKILLVDDEAIILATGREMLENFGYEVVAAQNGTEAIEIFKKRSQEFDLVILDMIMPDITGRECFFELKKILPDIKVILASGFAKEEDINEMRENGLVNFISKPYNCAELSEKIANAINTTQ